jgi:uncharacterized membrane protein
MANEKKYDTNPLDPEAARRAEEAWSDDATQALPGRETLRREEMAEDAPTRRYDGNPYQPYQSVYAPPQAAPYQQYPPTYAPPAVQHPPYQTPPAPPVVGPGAPPSNKPTGRTVAGLNLPENLLFIAPYIPLWVGAVAALVTLFLTPREEKRVRFHAAQGLAMHLAIMVIPLVLSLAQRFGAAIGAWTGLLGLVAGLFSLGSVIYLIVYLLKVWKGEETPVQPLAGITAWLEDNIAPGAK